MSKTAEISSDKHSTSSSKATAAAALKVIDEAPRSFKLSEYSMHTLKASLKELEKDVLRKLAAPMLKYFMDMYKAAMDDVENGKSEWEGGFADLRQFQENLRKIPNWNVEQIKAETGKVLAGVGSWPASDIVATILYIRAMILASIRPADMKDDLYIPIKSIETYLHIALTTMARALFRQPSIVRRFSDDDEDMAARNNDRIHEFAQQAITTALTDCVPTAAIVEKYCKGVITGARRESSASVMSESDKYGFDEPIDTELSDDDDEEEDHGHHGSDDESYSDSGSGSEDDEDFSDEDESEPELEQKHHRHHGHGQNAGHGNNKRVRIESPGTKSSKSKDVVQVPISDHKPTAPAPAPANRPRSSGRKV